MNYRDEIQKLLPTLKQWIRVKMAESGGTTALIGLSGGKDSSVTAGIMVEALGADHVIGILMPNGRQHDIEFAEGIAMHLGIRHRVIDINPMTTAFHAQLETVKGYLMEQVSEDTIVNLPARVRMTVLYALSQSIPGGRVINTGNLSEDWVGYATVYGDTAGAFAPLACFTTDEVIYLGSLVGIPEPYLVKPPEDGLTGKTDEQRLGFSYEVLNRYIREGLIEDPIVKEKIDRLHRISRFKFQTIPMYPAPLPILANDIANVYPW